MDMLASHLDTTPPFLRFFLMWAIFKACIEFVTVLFLVGFFFCLQACGIHLKSCGILASQPEVELIETWSLNHWTSREVPRAPLGGWNSQPWSPATLALKGSRLCLLLLLALAAGVQGSNPLKEWSAPCLADVGTQRLGPLSSHWGNSEGPS